MQRQAQSPYIISRKQQVIHPCAASASPCSWDAESRVAGGKSSSILPLDYETFRERANLAQIDVDHFKQGILGWVVGDHSAKTFEPLWAIVKLWPCYFYVTDAWSVYPGFIPDGDQIISKTYMTRVEGENTRLRHYLARRATPCRRRMHRKTLCYSKSEEMLRHSIRLLLHYLKFWDVPVPA